MCIFRLDAIPLSEDLRMARSRLTVFLGCLMIPAYLGFLCVRPALIHEMSSCEAVRKFQLVRAWMNPSTGVGLHDEVNVFSPSSERGENKNRARMSKRMDRIKDIGEVELGRRIVVSGKKEK